MFKKFFPLSSASSAKSRDKSSSSSNPSGESEIISKSEIPTLLRRHSFAIPKPQDIEVSEQSIDPFDKANTLRRSKSLQLEIPKPLPVLMRELRSPKAVTFDEEEETAPVLKPVFQPDQAQRNIQKGQPILQPNQVHRNIQKKLFDDSLESQTSHYSNESEKTDPIPEPKDGEPNNDKKFDENIHWLDEVANTNNTLRLNKLNIEYTLDESPVDRAQSNILQGLEDTLTESHETQSESTSESVQESGDLSLLKGLTSFDQSSPKKASYNEFIHILGGIIHEVDPSKTYKDFENTGSLVFQQVLDRLKEDKKTIEQKDLDICQLTTSNQQLTRGMEQLNVKLQQQAKTHNDMEKLKETNKTITNQLKETEYKLHDKIIQNTSLTNKVHQLETKIILMEVDSENNTTKLNRIYDIFQDKVGLNDQDSLEDYLVKVFDDHVTDHIKISELTEEVESLKDANAELENQTIRFKEFNETLITENEGFKEQINDIILEKDLQIMGKELELETTTNESQQTSCQLQTVSLQVLEHETNLKQAQQEIFELQNYNLQLELKINEMEDQLESLENVNHTLQNDLNVKVMDNKLYKNELEGLKHSSYIQTKESTVVINQLKQTIDLKNQELNDTNTTINNVEMEVLDKANLINNLTLQLSRLYQDNQFLQETKNDANTKLTCVRNDLEALTKSFKDVNGIIKEHEQTNHSLVNQLNQYMKSNETLNRFLIQLVINLEAKLKPMMYEESTSYMAEILKPLKLIKTFNDGHFEMLKEIVNFTTKAVLDLVDNYIEMEKVLQGELAQKNTNYNNMLNDLSQIMLTSLSKTREKDLLPSLSKTTEKGLLPKYLNESYVRNK